MSTSTAPASAGAQLSPEHIMQVGMGFWASKALLSAIEMELFTQLAGHPQDLETLRARAGLHPRAARDFLDALVALGFLERADGVYRNTPDTDAFLDKHKPSYLGGILGQCSAVWLLEQPHGGTAHGRVAERGQG